MIVSTDFRLRSIALTAYGPSALAAIGYGATLPVLPLLARHLGASVQLAALMIGLAGLGPLIASLPAGSLVDRIGERRTLVGAGVIDATAMTIMALAGNLPLFMVTALVSNIAWTAFLLARQGYMIDLVPAAHRARALSTLGGVHRIGAVVGPLLGAVLIDRWGIRAPFLLAAVASLAAAALTLTLPDLSAPARAEHAGVRMIEVLGAHRGVLFTLGTSVVVISGTRAVRAALVPLWAEHVGLDAEVISLIVGVSSAIELLLFYPAGWIMDRYGRFWVGWSCVAVMALGFCLLPLAHGAVTVQAVALVIGIGNGLGSGIVMTLGADAAPTRGRSQFLGAWRTCGEVGGVGGPLLLGGLAALAPLATAVVATGVVALVGSGWVGFWVHRAGRRAPAG
ncbi:MAG: MFS transporter [Kineosporiaceae bacterium]|nr:MFS transporter [Kineosporiaceae bacterium]MBK8076955.1 MFS transporter [Kineosporiaceae bacterium]